MSDSAINNPVNFESILAAEFERLNEDRRKFPKIVNLADTIRKLNAVEAALEVYG